MTTENCEIEALGIATGIPLYCMPTASGSAQAYSAIGRCIGLTRPVFGVRVLNNLTPFKSLPEMASVISTQLLLHNPRDPFHLLGYSFGGPLAYEVALELQSHRREVAFLAIIDQPPPWPSFSWPTRTLHFLRYIVPWATRAAGRVTRSSDFRSKYSSAMTRALSGKNDFEYADWYLESPDDRKHYMKSNTSVLYNHRITRRYKGEIILVRRQERNIDPLSMRPVSDFGWHQATGAKIRVLTYDGDHVSFIQRPELFKPLLAASASPPTDHQRTAINAKQISASCCR